MTEVLTDLIEGAIHDVAGDDFVAAGLRDKMLELVRSYWSRYTPEQIDSASVPNMACKACGGDVQQSIPVTAAWKLAMQAVKILDDVEDGAVQNDAATLKNAAHGMLGVAQRVLEEAGDDKTNPILGTSFMQMVLRMTAGQHGDIVTVQDGEYPDPDTWLEIVRLKTGELFAWGAWAGALVAGADEPALSAYREFGTHLGVLTQTADDLEDAWTSSGDIASGCLSLPVCYALQVLEGEKRERLLELLQRAQDDAAAEAQAQQMLIDVGAQHYMVAVARTQRKKGLEALRRAKPISEQEFVTFMDQLTPTL